MSNDYSCSFPFLDSHEFARAASALIPRLQRAGLACRLSGPNECPDAVEFTVLRDTDHFTVRTQAHIVLSPVYALPTLYFVSTLTDGLTSSTRAITLVDELYKYTIPHSAQPILEHSGIYGMSAVSQAENPITNLIGFYVHPCRTGEVMQTINQDRPIPIDEYLVVWFGIIGSVLGVGLL
ncbi:hypothetical protein BZA70DRAFT_288845 [Myxozyma melibiosi]|uniref:Ubiquitin-like-conjugating enzyme ATG10 n=1 Tax=Myxozyma melibiosi TaxID=54550 RepID=A0ABR1F729_9ASCO